MSLGSITNLSNFKKYLKKNTHQNITNHIYKIEEDLDNP
jgi:hypothetical protein